MKTKMFAIALIISATSACYGQESDDDWIDVGVPQEAGDHAFAVEQADDMQPCLFFGCDDGVECTIDRCTSVGCRHYYATNGTACTGGTCATGGICCAGCLGADGICYDGVSYDACGEAGVACENCDDGDPTTGDLCVNPIAPQGPAHCEHLAL